jgi:Phage portal protein
VIWGCASIGARSAYLVARVALFRRRPGRAIEAGAEERRAAAHGLPTEVTGISYGSGDELPVTVDEALACSAIAGALNVIAGRGCTLPLQRWRAEQELPAGAFLTHPEADSNLPLTVTIWHTLADMALAGVGYWRVLVRDFSGFPLVVRRIEPRRCAPRTELVAGIGVVVLGWLIDAIDFAERDVIAFSGPNPRGWCVDGARAIRTATALERAAKHYAEEPMPTLIFKNTSGVDLPDDKVKAILDRWKKSRGEATTGYVNSALDVDHVGFSAVDMQLTEGRQQAVLEIARLTGVPHGLLAASPQGATLTYRNIEGENQQALQAMAPYLVAIEQRLSGDDVVPHGQSVRFDLTELMRPATSDLVNMIATLYPMGLIGAGESRSLLGMGQAPTDLSPEPAPVAAPPASLAPAPTRSGPVP